MTMTAAPTPNEIDAVVFDMIAVEATGTQNDFDFDDVWECLAFDRDEELQGMGCGDTPAEAAACAWIVACGWPDKCDLRAVSRVVPDGWTFDVHEPGNPAIPTPTPADVEAVLAGLLDGSSAFARWLELIDDTAHRAYKSDRAELRRIGRSLYWADAINPDIGCVTETVTGGGHTPVEAAAAAWVIACLGPGDGIGRYPRQITEQEYLSVPRRVVEGWEFELFDWPASDPRSSKYQKKWERGEPT